MERECVCACARAIFSSRRGRSVCVHTSIYFRHLWQQGTNPCRSSANQKIKKSKNQKIKKSKNQNSDACGAVFHPAMLYAYAYNIGLALSRFWWWGWARLLLGGPRQGCCWVSVGRLLLGHAMQIVFDKWLWVWLGGGRRQRLGGVGLRKGTGGDRGGESEVEMRGRTQLERLLRHGQAVLDQKQLPFSARTKTGHCQTLR